MSALYIVQESIVGVVIRPRRCDARHLSILTTCFGPRITAAGLLGTAWPVTS